MLHTREHNDHKALKKVSVNENVSLVETVSINENTPTNYNKATKHITTNTHH